MINNLNKSFLACLTMGDKVPYSPHYGVKPMNLQGPFSRFQSRVDLDGEYQPADRKWRAQWLKDQHLSPKDAATSR